MYENLSLIILEQKYLCLRCHFALYVNRPVKKVDCSFNIHFILSAFHSERRYIYTQDIIATWKEFILCLMFNIKWFFVSRRTFAQNCRNIELLSLNGCTKITDRWVKDATCGNVCWSLLNYFLSVCSTCNSLSKFCPKLKHLDLASCTSITNLSLKALRSAFEDAHTCWLCKTLLLG